ncbi:MAG TPA: PSD1 and planctomycete cytochrome C domain-containing protein [Gemmataceae bacterium]|nr:PSD1 and planctomycete cytochrome C domain-containing protein [Gemmataceae bacterium]
MPRQLTFVALVGVSVTVASGPVAGSDQRTESPSFFGEIQPLLRSKCAKCHGEKVPKADLDLTTAAGLLKGGESGRVIVPGKPADSLLYEKVHAGEMPPKKEGRLTPAEVETIRKWIAAGAQTSADADGQRHGAVNQHDVLPILFRRCTACHGGHRQEAKLDLRTKASMLRGGKSGPAILPGKPDSSPLIQKARAGQMPPKDRLVEASVKPIEPAEIEILARWIAAGAPEIEIAPDVATTRPDPLVTDKDRDFWAFRPPREVPVPAARDLGRIRNPIDAFLLEKLEARALTFSQEADRATLIRRASFDLTGLPPDPAEVGAFLADRGPDAHERLIDRLLASPRYGERWGRRWLDLAGYADSEGKREQDLPRPAAWRYRDYVIRSLNADKPYDRFLVEQLAGDELADYEHAKEITPEVYDNLVATGFLRMVPDPTWANITGYVTDRLEVIADEIDVLGSAVMGLTLKCARCHSHKFDPLPQRDYYRLLAVFKGAYDENDWLKPDIRPGLGPVSSDVFAARLLPYVTTAERKSWEEQNAREKTDAEKKPEPKIQALWDRGHPSPTYVYRRGDPSNSGQLVGPGVPSVLTDGKTPFEVHPPWPGAKQTGRRLAFARWLVRPDHSLTARVMVNRLWKEHFGRGIVASLGNFGKAGSPPTHPELLDWLAREFVRSGWSMKHMHRLMMTSTAYRQQSAVTLDRKSIDPENVLVSRMPLVRLDAEALYDTLLLVAGRLDERKYGPADPVQLRPDGLVTPAGTAAGWRRLVYVQQARKQLPTHLENFDFPQMNPNCVERRDSTVAPQALYLMNNAMIDHLAEEFAKRVTSEAGTDPAAQVERVCRIALSRPPTDSEKQVGLRALKELRDDWVKAGKLDGAAAGRKALATYCHAVVNSAGFLYVD